MFGRIRGRLGRPSPTLVVAFTALLVALGGTAYAATTIVNIADPANAAHVAKVDANGKLLVGDGSGPLSVDGTVTANAQAAAPGAFYHHVTLGLGSAQGCMTIATPPANKALIIRQVRVDVFNDPSPGSSQLVAMWPNATCSGPLVADINPGAVGQTVVPFDPGLGIPAGGALSASANGSVQAEAYVDGFTVAPSVVPDSNVTRSASGGPGQQR